MKAPIIKPASIFDLIQKDLPPFPAWIGPAVLPKGGMLLFGGHAKVGKSFLMLELARALATGAVPFGCPFLQTFGPCKVLLIEMELGEYGLQDRVKKIFAEEQPAVYGENMWYVTKVPSMQLDSDLGQQQLDAVLEKVQPNVLMLDPIGRFHSCDENRSDEIQELLNFLEMLLQKYKHNQMSIIMSHHFGKKPGNMREARDPLDPYNFRGSSKWFDNLDSLITVNRLKDLDVPWRAWNLEARFETRQGEPPEDVLMSVNREADLRVRFEHSMGDKTPPMKKPGDNVAQMPKKQLRFNQA